MTELVPRGIPTKKWVPHYQTMLGRLRPRDLVGRTLPAAGRGPARRPGPPRRPPQKALEAELTEAVRASGSYLLDLPGIEPAVAARILADVGDVRRFPDSNRELTGRVAPHDPARPVA